MPRKKLPVVVDGALRSLAEEKLASSGLDLHDAKQLGISVLETLETCQALGHNLYPYRALRFAYCDPAGKPIEEHGKKFFRLRFLDAPKADAAKEVLTGKKDKPPRYVQPKGTAIYPYYPTNQAWSELLANPDETLIITEGELKAAKACKEGFPTIGLGGVWNWRSLDHGVEWLPLLAEPWVQWAGRKVVICFDSDYVQNPNVCMAIQALAEKLERLGANSYIVTLPSIPDVEGKVGLDDFLTLGGPTAVSDFEDKLVNAEPLGLSAPLWALNEKYCYVRDPGLIIDRRIRFKVTPTNFTGHLEATSVYYQGKFNAKGALVRTEVPAAPHWLKWPLRTTADRVTYLPGRAEFVNRELNLWPGWGCEPKKGDVKPFLQLINHLFEGSEPEAKTWFMRWLAYPLQHPGTKLFTSAVVHGLQEGTGKSLLGYTIGKIYGKNFSAIGQADLQGGFNEWAAEKQFVMGDDVTGTNKYEQADLLKKLITQHEMRINQKYVPSFVVPDCLNYYFTTNRGDSFLLGDHDRRMFIHEVLAGPLDREFYTAYRDWMKAEGPSAVFHYLLNLDLGDWDPASPALRTEAKERMTSSSRSDLGEWVRELKMMPDHITLMGDVVINKDLFTSKELLAFYDPEGKTRTTANGMARELGRAGVPQVLGGRPIRLADGSQHRFYAIRNPETWAKCASSKPISDHVDNWKPEVKRRKF